MPTGFLQPVETQGNDDGRTFAKHQWQTSAFGREEPDAVAKPQTCRSEYPRAAIGCCSGIRAVGHSRPVSFPQQ